MKKWSTKQPDRCGWWLVRWPGHPGGRVYVTNEYGGEMRAYNGLKFCPLADMTIPGTEWAKSGQHKGDAEVVAAISAGGHCGPSRS